MKSTFQDFVNRDHFCAKYKSTALDIFEFLSEEVNIGKMIYSTALGDAAFADCAIEVETKFCNTRFITVHKNRKAVGRMIAEILLPYGFKPKTKNKRVALKNTTIFKTATIYEKI